MKRNTILFVFGLVVIAVLVVWKISTRDSGDKTSPADGDGAGNGASIEGGGERPVTVDLMRTAIAAVASAENLDFDRSVELWEELAAEVPDNPSIRINRAVTVLKWIEESNNLLTSGKIQGEEEMADLKAELESAYQLAESIIQSLHELDVDDYRASLLEAEILRARALRADPEEAATLRRQAVQVLAAALRDDPAQPILAASFDDMVQEFLGSDPELGALQVESLYASYQAMPRNTFLLFRACDVLLRNRDPRLGDLLDATLELTLPMRGDVANYLRRLDPDQVVRESQQAIADGDWNKARLVIR